MNTIKFEYLGQTIDIQCSGNEKMGEICKVFARKAKIENLNKLAFLYSGDNLNMELTCSKIINSIDRERKIMSIVVFEQNPKTIISIPKISKSIYPMCQICNEMMIFEMKDYKIICRGCKNGHLVNLFINEYEDFQKTDLSKIICDECGKNKHKTFNNEMNICNICDINLCPLDKNKHDKSHNLINYDLKYYICKEHNESYISYCSTCKINICFQCQKDHLNHDIILYGEILPNKNELFEKLKGFRTVINTFNDNIDEIIKKLNNVKENLELLYNIYYNMVEKYEDKFRNYEVFQSLNYINDNEIQKDLERINQINSTTNKFENILSIYEKINFFDITMIYNINKVDKVKILGKIFVENNKKICSIAHKNQDIELTEELDVKDLNEDKLIIKLKGINNIKTMKGMFYQCDLLEELPDLDKFDTNQIYDMSYLFYECSSLKSLPDLSRWDTSNVVNMECMFYECSSLKSLPDISQWDTNGINYINHLFFRCSSLISLPDISKWNTSNIINMKSLFCGCKSLISLPDISKWNMSQVINISYMFSECSKISSFPDISEWDISQVKDMSDLFNECKSLEALPDKSKWNTEQVTEMDEIFSKCSLLTTIPDISIWNTSNLNNINSMFYECNSLKSLPDISNWNTSKVIEMNHLFYDCSSLDYLPDISKWDTSNVTNMKSLFCNCKSLVNLPDISSWKTNKLTNISYIFSGCTKLKSIPDISKWNTSN